MNLDFKTWFYTAKDGVKITIHDKITVKEVRAVFKNNPEKFKRTFYCDEPYWHTEADDVKIPYFSFYIDNEIIGFVWISDLTFDSGEIHYCLFPKGFRYFIDITPWFLSNLGLSKVVAHFPDTPKYKRSHKFCEVSGFVEDTSIKATIFSSYENKIVEIKKYVLSK